MTSKKAFLWIMIAAVAVCALVLVFRLGGNKTLTGKEVSLLKDGEIVSIGVLSEPASFDMTVTEKENIAKVVSYFENIKVTGDFDEDPDRYGGMTYTVTFAYDDGSERKIVHFGNMFVRADGETWYKMDYSDAVKLKDVLTDVEPGCDAFKTIASGTYSATLSFEDFGKVIIAQKDGAVAYCDAGEKTVIGIMTPKEEYKIDIDKKTYEVTSGYGGYELLYIDRKDYKFDSCVKDGEKTTYVYKRKELELSFIYEGGKFTKVGIFLPNTVLDYEMKYYLDVLEFSSDVPEWMIFSIPDGYGEDELKRLKRLYPDYFTYSGDLEIFVWKTGDDEYKCCLAENYLKQKSLSYLNSLPEISVDEMKTIIEWYYDFISDYNINIYPFDNPECSYPQEPHTITADTLKELFEEGFDYKSEYYKYKEE